MKINKRLIILILSLFQVLFLCPLNTLGQGTTFTYQGMFSENGTATTGTNYGMGFGLYDAPTNGNLLGNLLISSVTVSNGLFTVALSFGNVFDGTPRWLEIRIQKNGGSFTTLTPRQSILPTPYAIVASSTITADNASNLTGYLPVSQLSGALQPAQLPDSVITNNENGVNLAGQFGGNGAGLTNLNASQISGGTLSMAQLPPAVAANNLTFTFTNGMPRIYAPNPYTTLDQFYGTLGYLLAVTNASGIVPLLVVGQENGNDGSLVGRLATVSWPVPADGPMMNCGRYFGYMGNWTGDQRPLVLKGEGATSGNSGGGAFILETQAAVGSPGTHGVFNNSLYVATNGLAAFGNLTDRADQNDNALKPPFWLTIYGDGSTWSGGSSKVPGFGIMPKPLVSTTVAAAEENDGANRWWTDNNAIRRRYLMDQLPGDGSGLTNVFALGVKTNTTPNVTPGYGYFWPSNYNLYWVTPTKTNLIVVGQ